LQNAIVKIQNTSEQQGSDTTGVTTDKKLLRNSLVTLAADTGRKLAAYAKQNNIQILLNEAGLSESDLKEASDTKLRDDTQRICDRAQSNISGVANFGINDATQNALQTAINNFNASIGKPRIGSLETSQATKLLVTYFKDGDAALDNIDAVVEIIRLTEPTFYISYKPARRLIFKGAKTLAIKGLVTDTASGNGLKGVKLIFTLDGQEPLVKSANGNNGFEKKTAAKGGFMVSKAGDGNYSVLAVMPGYK
jgi:hypothetical protein